MDDMWGWDQWCWDWIQWTRQYWGWNKMNQMKGVWLMRCGERRILGQVKRCGEKMRCGWGWDGIGRNDINEIWKWMRYGRKWDKI